MTRCIVLGNPNKEEKTKQLIEFTHYLTGTKEQPVILASSSIGMLPQSYSAIELVSKNYVYELDLMFALDDEQQRGSGILFLGHWNDGVVE